MLQVDLPPISVCFTVGCSSWYRHIRLRSASVRVRRGDDVVGADDADVGVTMGVPAAAPTAAAVAGEGAV
jgi:hypothetical protein